MAMAYDMNKFSTPESTGTWLREWAARQFGNAVADVTASIMTKYGTLCARRKYEDLSITPFAFSATEYDEAELNYAAWVDLLNVTQAAYNTLPADVQPSYFEMVLHPVMAGKTVFEIYTNAALANRYAGETRLTANELAQGARDAFSRDQQITRQYHTLLGGKWNHMMDQTHIGYNNWQEPAQNSLPTLRTVSANAARSGKQFGIGVQSPGRPGVSAAADAATVTLAPIDQFTPERRYFDVFLRTTGSLSFTVSTDAAFVSLSSTGGNLASTGGPAQQRIYVSIPDWAAVPAGTTSVSIVVRAGSASTTVNVPLVIRPALPADFKKGHVESGGVVSIEAPHWTTASAGNPSYVAIPDLGRTLGSVKLWPVTAPSQSPASGPFLSYDFYTFTAPTGSNVRVTVYLSASENADVEHPNRFALSIDNGTTVTVQPVPLASNAGNEPPGWDAAVTSNAWVRDVTVSPGGGALRPGKHTLRVWLLEPTMVLAKLVIDLGGRRPSELGPPESVWLSGV